MSKLEIIKVSDLGSARNVAGKGKFPSLRLERPG